MGGCSRHGVENYVEKSLLLILDPPRVIGLTWYGPPTIKQPTGTHRVAQFLVGFVPVTHGGTQSQLGQAGHGDGPARSGSAVAPGAGSGPPQYVLLPVPW